MEESITTECLRAILLLGISTIIWVVIKLKHGHAGVSLNWLEGVVEGYTINAAMWSGIIGLAVTVAYYNTTWVLHLVLLILFTKAFGVLTFIEVSSTIMSIFWGIEKQSNGRLDYRIPVVTAIAIVAIVLIVFYFMKGFPENPATFP